VSYSKAFSSIGRRIPDLSQISVNRDEQNDTYCTKGDGRDNGKHEKCEVRRNVQHSTDFIASHSAYEIETKETVLTASKGHHYSAEAI
jgi:hypothetical protein